MSNAIALAFTASLVLATACATPKTIVYTSHSDQDTGTLVPLAAAAARTLGYQVTKEDDARGVFVAVRPDTVPMLVQLEHPLPLYLSQREGCWNGCETDVEVTPFRVDHGRVATVDLGSEREVSDAARDLAGAIRSHAR